MKDVLMNKIFTWVIKDENRLLDFFIYIISNSNTDVENKNNIENKPIVFPPVLKKKRGRPPKAK